MKLNLNIENLKQALDYTPLSGFHGVISGFLVSIKQIIPDQEIPFLKIKMKVLLCQSAFQEILKQMMNKQSSDDACVTSGELLEEIVAKESASLMKDSRRKREDIGKGLVHDQYQLRDAKTGKVMQRLRT
ncbi:uncharacterized protein [Cicer arietinum]|uniref:Uncharacterized protein LOC101502868 n=1 Tax=Cicer arietinum TaxID=3827 RepID=A0A1S3DX40_CICAR|nr:uncharacterized protein LOC101502868 [Cicer arietinum]